MSKKIAIDCRKISDKVGVSTYLKHLLMAINKIKDKSLYFFFLVNEDFNFNDYLSKNQNYEIIKIKSKSYSAFQHIEIPLLLNKKNIDFFHEPFIDIPIFMFLAPKCRLITTIHDVIPLKHPQFITGFMKKIYLNFILKLCGLLSYKIITISEYSKNDIKQILNVPDRKISRIYQGHLTDNIDYSEFEKNRKITDILFVGALYEHKNIISLIKAVKILTDKNVVVNLRIAGIETMYANVLRNEIKKLKIENHITFLGKISDEQIEKEYQKAGLFAFPSLEEGFGLPLIEAMNYSIPIISSNKSVMPEIVGDAGILIDPTPENFAEKIEYSINNPDIVNDLIQKGFRRKEVFSNKNFEDNMEEFYHDC